MVVRAWPGSRRQDWRFSVTPPRAVGKLLKFCSGLEFAVSQWSGLLIAEIDFTGRSIRAAFEFDFMPDALPIAGDGCGNFWVLDMAAGTWGPIYFCCHDAPVVLLQVRSLTEFLSEVFKMFAPPHQSLVDDVHSDRVFEVWLKNPGVLSHKVAIASPDAVIRKFAASLGEEYEIVDLRDVPIFPIGMGFEWGRSRPPDVIRRIGAEPIFALPRVAEKKSLFAWLFGR